MTAATNATATAIPTMGSGGRIRIDDLLDPLLTPRQTAALAAAEKTPVSMRSDAVLSAAIRATGLSDFGSDDFLPRLELWLQSFEDDTGLTQLGRAGLFQECVRHAANRLRIEDLLRRHPEILDIEIDRPIVVAGLPRSGTTHLLNLMSVDHRFRSLPYWESVAPVPGPEAFLPGKEDPRQVSCRAAWQEYDQLLPLLKNMHEMSPEHVHEENELQGPDFSNYNIEWTSRPHRWRDHYLSTDQTPHYRYLKKVLQVLTWHRGPNRWVLKSPQHLENLTPLLTAFPDAIVVMTHRDPVAVIQSALTMIAYGDRLRRKAIEPAETARYWIDRIEHMLRCCVRDRGKLPVALDVMFHDINADAVAVVQRIYEQAGLELTAASRRAFDDHLHQHPRGKYGQVLYDLERDFAITQRALRDRFGFYYPHFPIRIEA